MVDSRQLNAAVGAAIIIALAGITCWGAWEESRRWTMVGALFLWALVLAALWFRKASFGLGAILGVAILLRAVVFPLPPVLSDDVYRYLWDGMLTAEGVNPFAHRPSDPEMERFQNLDLFPLLNSQEYYSIYPASSQVLFAAAGFLHGRDMVSGIYLIKGLLGSCELGALFLLARLLDRRKLMLYAWCPVIVLELWGQAHTEAIAVLGIAVCLWATKKSSNAGETVPRGAVLAGAALALAGWAKLYPLLLAPFLWRRLGWRAFAGAGAMSIILWLPFLAGFSPGNFLESLGLYVRSFEFNAGPYYALKAATTFPLRVAGIAGPGEETSKLVGPFLAAVFFAGYGVILWRDKKLEMPFETVGALVIMLMLVTSTTVHPWYVTPLLVLILFSKHLWWSWQWLSVVSLGTYLFYTHDVYWPFVWLGWGGWAALFLWKDAPFLLAALMRQRAREKWDLVRSVPGISWKGRAVLDLGAGEGYVGEMMRDEGGACVTLADVVDLNRSSLPLTRYDGERLPFADRSFDIVTLVYVLHHCEAPGAVIKEALRVSRDRVIVIESVYDAPWNRRLLEFLDRIANRMRSGGKMNAQEEHLDFRTVDEWKRLFDEAGAKVDDVVRTGNRIHRKAVFNLRMEDG